MPPPIFPPGHDEEERFLHQLRRIADALEQSNDILKMTNETLEESNEELRNVVEELQCICKALQAPPPLKAQSATLTISHLVKKEN